MTCTNAISFFLRKQTVQSESEQKKHIDDIITLRGRVYRMQMIKIPKKLPYPYNDMYDLRYKKHCETAMSMYITCKLGIFDTSHIHEYHNEIMNLPVMKKHVCRLLSCKYHEEYTWRSDDSSSDEN